MLNLIRSAPLWRAVCTLAVAAFAVGGTANAATTGLPLPLDDPGHWATITHAGNAPFQFTDAFGSHSVGGVNHEYRISKTETTAGEWIDFVQAYAPFVAQDERGSLLYTGFYTDIQVLPDGTYDYSINDAGRPYPQVAGFRYLARYCNWLHNGRVNEAWAFESGAYDTSTFTGDFENGFTDQPAHSPGARYWVPTQDEWVKAAYFDPNRFGENQPGYWRYNITSDTQPVPGVPGVGQTNAREIGDPVSYSEYPVGSYADVMSPWGLFDTSGGWTEWTETAIPEPNGLHVLRFVCGSGNNSNVGNDDLLLVDRLARFSTFSYAGMRLASSIPSPGLGAWCVPALMTLHRGRRSVSHESSTCSTRRDPRDHRCGAAAR